MQTQEQKQKKYEDITAIYQATLVPQRLVNEYDRVLWSEDEIVTFRGEQVNRDVAMETIKIDMLATKQVFSDAVDRL